ncbi:putative monocarboxylate transporter mch1 [Mortierella claussenii]|nr:putative monocarboxylate transporter mch1 [Mortierella claussenii]
MDCKHPSDVELLDMAREVLSVCSDRPLRDIIDDLVITKSSEATINRIFDGQFLLPLQAAVATTTSTSESVFSLLSSSDDDTSDNDEFLRVVVGKATKRGSALSEAVVTRGQSPVVKTEIQYPISQCSPSPIAQRDPSPIIKRDPSPIIKRDPSPNFKQKYSSANNRSPSLTIERDPSPIIKQDPSPIIKQDPSPAIKRDTSPAQRPARIIRTLSPTVGRTPSPTSKPNLSLSPRRSPSPFLDDYDGWDSWNANNDAGAEDLLEFPSTKARADSVAPDVEPIVVDLHRTPVRTSRKSGDKFQLVSPLNQSAFSDWDYELILSPGQGTRSPTVMFSPPRSSQNKAPGFDSDLLSCNSPTFVLEKRPTVGSKLVKSAFANDQETVSRTTSATVLSSPSSSTPSSPSLTPLMHRSLNRSPTANDLLPRTSRIYSIDDDHDDRIQLTRESSTGNLDEKWEHLLDRDLSPPRNPVDDLYDSEMEEMMKDMSWKSSSKMKKSISRASSSKSVTGSASSSQRGHKRTSALAGVNLDEWDADLDGLGDKGLDGLSLEVEIVNRAKRRQKKTKVRTEDEDEDEELPSTQSSASQTALRKAEKQAEREAEKEAQRQAREAQKLAKEAEKLANKAAREQEQQKKRELKEQERQAEKKAARELRIANKLTTKSEGAKEMILCIEQSLYLSSFGDTLQDYLLPVECQVNLLQVAGEAKPTPTQMHGVSMDNVNEPIPMRNIIFWRRIVRHRYDDDQDMFVPLAEKEIELQPFALIYATAKNFVAWIEQGRLKDIIATIKRDMRLRRNKERLKMSSKHLHQPMLLKEDPRHRQRVIFLISGIENYFRQIRKATTKRFQQAVLASLNSNTGQGQGAALSGINREDELVIDQERIEEEMLWLQLNQDCLVILSNDEEETAQALVSLTEQIGLRPYKDVRKTSLNVCVEGIKSGQNPSDTWVKSLQEIHMVTLTVAKSIAVEYPTLRSLYEGYRRCESVYQAQLMLEDIQILGRRVFVGKALSRRIYDVFMSEDPDRSVS